MHIFVRSSVTSPIIAHRSIVTASQSSHQTLRRQLDPCLTWRTTRSSVQSRRSDPGALATSSPGPIDREWFFPPLSLSSSPAFVVRPRLASPPSRVTKQPHPLSSEVVPSSCNLHYAAGWSAGSRQQTGHQVSSSVVAASRRSPRLPRSSVLAVTARAGRGLLWNARDFRHRHVCALLRLLPENELTPRAQECALPAAYPRGPHDAPDHPGRSDHHLPGGREPRQGDTRRGRAHRRRCEPRARGLGRRGGMHVCDRRVRRQPPEAVRRWTPGEKGKNYAILQARRRDVVTGTLNGKMSSATMMPNRIMLMFMPGRVGLPLLQRAQPGPEQCKSRPESEGFVDETPVRDG